MSPIGAITNRLVGLNIRGGGAQNASNSKATNSPRSTTHKRKNNNKEEYQTKVASLLRDPNLFAAFKRRVSATKNFSNAGANFVLHEFLEELELPGSGPPALDNANDQNESATIANNNNNSGNGFNNGFGLLQSLRSMTLDPQTPHVSYQNSPKGRFECPESPGSVQNLSPTKTPLTPISATTASTSATTPRSPESIDLITSSTGNSRKAKVNTGTRAKSNLPECLNQPSL